MGGSGTSIGLKETSDENQVFSKLARTPEKIAVTRKTSTGGILVWP
jgi:hypothetical protein